MLSLALRGLFNQIQIEQVLYTSFGLIAIVGVISLALAVYYLRKGREAYVIYQTVEEEEANEKGICECLSLLGLWNSCFEHFDDCDALLFSNCHFSSN